MSQVVANPEPRPDEPPADTFIARYSPHHELPVSGASSISIHALVIVVAALSAFGVFRFWKGAAPVELEPVIVGDGGDGRVEGPGIKGDVVGPPSAEAVAPGTSPETKPQPAARPDPLFRPSPVPVPTVKDDANPEQLPAATLAALREADRRLRDKLVAGLGQSNQPGPGLGQQGDGPGAGLGNRPGPAGNVRGRRVERWTMLFSTSGGPDYVRQLAALGAILGVRRPDGSVLVIRDLRRGAAGGKVEDVSQIRRIFWADDNPESVASLAEALGISPAPAQIISFFPESLEQELLRKELAFQGKNEEQIEETVFRIGFRAGKPDIRVTKQTLKK
jgi:hypothetical protein